MKNKKQVNNLIESSFNRLKQTIVNNPITIIIGIFVIVHILHLITRYHFVLWDEAVYIGIGKYIWSLGNVGLWEEIRPLGLPVILGFLWKISLNPIFWGRIIEMLFASGCIILVYKITNRLFNKQTAIISTIIFMITPIFLYNSFRLMTGIPSTFFVLLTVYLFIRKNYITAGLTTAWAFLFRYPSGLIFLCCLGALFIEFILLKETFLKKTKSYIIKGVKYILGFAPLVISLFMLNSYLYNSMFYPFIRASSHGGNLVYSTQNKLLNLFYYPFNLVIQNHLLLFSLIGTVSIVYMIYRLFKIPIGNIIGKNKQNIEGKKLIIDTRLTIDKETTGKILITLSLFVFLTYFTYITNKQIRFSLLFLPFIAIIAGHGIEIMIKAIKSIKTLTPQKWLLVLPMILLIAFSIYSISLSLHKDYNQFNRFPVEKPAIVDEYYKFFPDGFEGIILTADPVHVAYSDIKMAPYYYSTEEGDEIYNRWITDPMLIKKVSAVVFIPTPFVCFDMVCEEQLRPNLFKTIKNTANNKLVFEKEYEEVKSIYYLEN